MGVRTSIRRIVSGLGALGIGLALLFPVVAQSQDTVRHGIQIGALGALRTTLPRVQDKYNLQYDIKDFGDSTAALRALDQGELEIANTTAQHLVRAVGEGFDVVWVAGWGGGYNVLVARNGLELSETDADAVRTAIMERKDSARVKIGVPTGSMQHAKLIQYLSSIGVDAEADVEVVNIPFPNHPRALQAGEVDMAMTLASFGVLAIQQGNATMVAHLFEGDYGKQEVGFIVQRELIERNPDLVERIIRSHVEAMDMFIGDMDQQIAYEKEYSRFPPAVVETAERDFLRYHYRTNVPDLQAMAGMLHQLGWMNENLSGQMDSALDLSILARVTGMSTEELSRW